VGAKILGVFIFCTSLLIGAIACNSSGVAPNGMTGAEILNMSNSIVINTVQFNATVGLDFLGETSEVNIVGIANESNKEMYLNETSQNTNNVLFQMYAINGQLYMTDPRDNASWVRIELVDKIWEDANKAGSYMASLENFDKARYVGMENISGTKCYKIEINPDKEALLNILGLSSSRNVSTEEMTSMIKDPHCFAWIAENSYYPLQIFFTLIFDTQFLGDMSINSTIGFSGFNYPVVITLPVGAENATEISFDEFMASGY